MINLVVLFVKCTWNMIMLLNFVDNWSVEDKFNYTVTWIFI